MSFNFPSLRQFQHIRRTVDQWRRWEVELQGLPSQHQRLIQQALMVARADNRANKNYDKRLFIAYKKGLSRILNGEEIQGVTDRIQLEVPSRTLRSFISRTSGLNNDTGAGQNLDAVVEPGGEVIVAAVEDDDGDQSIDDVDGNGNVLEQEKDQVSGGTAVESFAEKDSRQVHAHSKVSRILKTKQQLCLKDSEKSSSEEDDSEDETRMREEKHDDGDGEEQIQLAPRDDVAEVDRGEEEEVAELIEVDEDEEKIKIIEADEEYNKEDSMEVKIDDLKKKNRVEEIEEESDHESNHDEPDDDADLREDTQQSTIERQPTRKRSSSGDSFSLSTKRAREDSSATRDLAREAFIERAKQERVQRDELFQLERAKLTCELQAKQVQLAMERCLARMELLGAGVDPVEVDRILPL